MSPQQPGHLDCFGGATPKRSLRDGKNHYSRNEFVYSPSKNCNVTCTSRNRSRRLFTNRPSSEELSLNNRRYSYSEPLCLSADSSPVNKAPSLICKSVPFTLFSGVPEITKLPSTSQSLKKKRNGFRQLQLQSPESLKVLADRYASSRYSDSPKAKQLPLPPVDWIDEGSSSAHFSEQLSVSSSSSHGSPVLFSTSFSSGLSESSCSPSRSPVLMLEEAKICRATSMHMNALQLIEAVSAS